MIYRTSDFELFDSCERKFVWEKQWTYPRVALADALYRSLDAGLTTGNPERAKDALMEIAARPGIALSIWNLFDSITHHSHMLEVITHYLLAGNGPWTPADPVPFHDDTYQPLSYQLPDGRLRRVVLCSWWDEMRKAEEIASWRTVADTVATGRSILLNAVSIGQMKAGWRQSPWTRCYIHPTNGTMRIQRREGEKFSDSWKKVYRERTTCDPEKWLKLMQDDGAFDDLVDSVVVDVPGRYKEIQGQMRQMMREMKTATDAKMRRAACFKLGACGFSAVCHGSKPGNPETYRYPLVNIS